MITALDTSVLLAILKGEPQAGAWVAIIADSRRAGEVSACDVVIAELSCFLRDDSLVLRILRDFDVQFSPISLDAALCAGQIFKRYRDAGGPREQLIPDFLIAAHASVQADRLLAADRGNLRTYFPELDVVKI